MKVSLNWVRQFTDVNMPVEKLVEKIGAQLGAVEEVVDLGKRYEGALVVRVVDCLKHPEADKLYLCRIDDGGVKKKLPRDREDLVQVVCGAANVRAGMLAVWLPPGMIVPATYGREEQLLAAKEIRGVLSQGMLASPKELDFHDDHEGLLTIDEDIAPGSSFAKAFKLDDHIIDIENKMFTHRPDLFGILGIAREIAGIQGQKFHSPAWYLDGKAAGRIKGAGLPLSVKNEIPRLVPRFCAVSISGVRVGPSPLWLQSYLMRVGIRPINNVVDLTNFVMYETAQPLHAYDYDKVKGAGLITRLAKPGEKLKLLDGKTVKLAEDTIVIADKNGPIGLGGVMGGADTEVDEQTKNLILECANFDMNAIRRSAFVYGLFTDAAVRFTKNQSPRQNLVVLAKLAEDITRITGGQPAGFLVDNQGRSVDRPAAVRTNAGFINSRLGLNLPPSAMAKLLNNVEIPAKVSGRNLTVQPPFWRTDLEIPEDLVEEVGRLYGYDHLLLELPPRDLRPAALNESIYFKDRLRSVLSRAGANEILTYSFVHESLIDQAGQEAADAYHLRNALSPRLQYYRMSLAPSLLEKIHPNVKAGFKRFVLYEIGSTHVKGLLDKERLPRQLERLALAAADDSPGKNAGAAYYLARRYCQFIATELGLPGIDWAELTQNTVLEPAWRSTAKSFERGRSAVLQSDGRTIGLAGEPIASLTQSLKLPAYTAIAELDLTAVRALSARVGYRPLNRFPSLTQDVCFRAPAGLPHGRLQGFIDEFLNNAADRNGYQFKISPVDIYQPTDRKENKQMTWHIEVWHPDRTLQTSEINKLIEKLAALARTRLKAIRI